MEYIKTVYVKQHPVLFAPYLYIEEVDGRSSAYSCDGEGRIKKTKERVSGKCGDLKKHDVEMGVLLLLGETRLVGDVNERRKRFLHVR